MSDAHRHDAIDARPVEIVIVTAPRCHFCDDAAELLRDLGAQYPIVTREVGLESDEGIAIARRFRVAFPPVVLINGTYFGYGRISRRKLVKALDQAVGIREDRSNTVATSDGGE